MKTLTIGFMLLSLLSCGANVRISSMGCPNLKFLNLENPGQRRPDFEIEHVLWTEGAFDKATNRSLSRALDSHDIDCAEVEAINYTFKDTWKDILMGFVPLMNRQTLVVRGVYRISRSK